MFGYGPELSCGRYNESAESIIKYCTDNSYTIGKEITYEKNGKTFVGMADKLFPDGTLGVKLSDGNYDVLNSGEISVKTVKKS